MHPIDRSLQGGLCGRNLSFQCGLIGFVRRFKCSLCGIQCIAQRFDLIVQRLVAVCNGFVEFCFGIIKILLHLIDPSLQGSLCGRNLSFQYGLIGFVRRFKCRLCGCQCIAQRFDLIVQRLVAVCNGFFQSFLDLFKFVLQLLQRIRGECPFRSQYQIFVHGRVKVVHKVPVIPANEGAYILRRDRHFYGLAFLNYEGCVNLAVAVEVNRDYVLILADTGHFAIVHTGFDVACRVFAVAGHVTEERGFGIVYLEFFNAALGYHSTGDYTAVCPNRRIAVYRTAFSRRRAIFNHASAE